MMDCDLCAFWKYDKQTLEDTRTRLSRRFAFLQTYFLYFLLHQFELVVATSVGPLRSS